MTHVTIEPSGIQLDVRDDESVAEAAWRLGYRWPTKCWGQADCMACITTIVDGERSAKPADQFELDQMRLKVPPRLQGSTKRLGCQLRVKGPGLVLEKKGVRPERDSDANMSKSAVSTHESGKP